MIHNVITHQKKASPTIRMLIASLFISSLGLSMKWAFQIQALPYGALILLPVVAMLFMKIPEKWLRIFYIAIATIVVVTVPIWIRGMTTIYNEVSAFIGATWGYYWPQFDNEGFANLSAYFISVIAAAIVYYWHSREWRWPYVTLWLSAVFMQVIITVHVPMWLQALQFLLLMSIVLLPSMTYSKKAYRLWGGVAASLFIGLTVMQWLPSQQSTIRTSSISKLADWRYGINQSDWHNNGNMQQLGRGKVTDEVALAVIMDTPTALYLRGFVGATYAKNQWQALSNETIYKAQPLLASLHTAKLDSTTLLSQAHQQTMKSETSMMRVYPKNVSTQYSYTPYEIITAEQATGYYQDGINSKNQWLENEYYEYKIAPQAVVQYPLVALDKKTSSFLDAESHYNTFAYQHYIQITKAERTLLTSHLGVVPKERLSYAQTIKKVKTFMKKEMRYDTNTKVVPQGTNFVQYTLENTKRGYSPQYATIATLAFRYLGVPARYVEGYVVTNDLVANKQALSEINVTGKEAHAWPEIYIDQLGWVPVEVTPGFEKKMPKLETPKTTGQNASVNTTAPKQPMQVAGEQQGQQETITDQQQMIEPAPKKEKQELPWWLWLIIGGVVCIVVIATLIYWKRRKIRRWHKQLHSEDAVQAATAAIQLVQWQFVKILKRHNPAHSLFGWLDVLPTEYQAVMQRLIVSYQAVTYGSKQEDLEKELAEIQQMLRREKAGLYPLFYWINGYLLKIAK